MNVSPNKQSDAETLQFEEQRTTRFAAVSVQVLALVTSFLYIDGYFSPASATAIFLPASVVAICLWLHSIRVICAGCGRTIALESHNTNRFRPGHFCTCVASVVEGGGKTPISACAEPDDDHQSGCDWSGSGPAPSSARHLAEARFPHEHGQRRSRNQRLISMAVFCNLFSAMILGHRADAHKAIADMFTSINPPVSHTQAGSEHPENDETRLRNDIFEGVPETSLRQHEDVESGPPVFDWDDEINKATIVIRSNPNSPDAFAHRAICRLHRIDEGIAEPNEIENAHSDATRAIELDARCGLAYRARGNVLVKRKQYQEAAEDFDIALSLLGEDSWTLTARANTRLFRGFFSAATEDSSRAITLNSNSGGAFATRAEARWLAGEGPISLVLDDCKRALELNPRAARVLAVRAFAFLYLERFQAAEEDLDDYEKLVPPTEYGRFIRHIGSGLRLLRAEQFTEAITAFERSVIALTSAFKEEKSPAYRIQKAIVLRLVGLCHAAQGNLNDAGEKFEEAVRTFPERDWNTN